MHSVPCPVCRRGPWVTSTFHWYHRPESQQFVLLVGGKVSWRLDLDAPSEAAVLAHLLHVTSLGYCDEIGGALVRALIDLGHIRQPEVV